MNKKNATTLFGLMPFLYALSMIMISGSYSYTANAQIEGTPGEAGVVNKSEPDFPPLNLTSPETAQEFEDIAGSDEAIFANDTAISNPNITALESTDINIEESCIELPNQSGVDCP